MSQFRSGRALAITFGVALVLGAVAFWPPAAYEAPPRPALERPIVFDAMNTATLPQATPPPSANVPAEPGR